MNGEKPWIAITLGDVAGIGPELVLKAWPQLQSIANCIVIGDPSILERDLVEVPWGLDIDRISAARQVEPSPKRIPCLPASPETLAHLERGRVHAAAARASIDWLHAAIEMARSGQVHAIVTLPIHKLGLKRAGIEEPGHTEILARATETERVAMMLYRRGLGVVHATLHVALREVFHQLTTGRVRESIELLDQMMRRLEGRPCRLGIAALNPHASDGGRFGDEEVRIIAPAVAEAHQAGIDCVGPLPADTLFASAAAGGFDGVVAMYHDQGHIALKLLGWRESVNITCGLPIVRTSVAHGTAYDIAGQGLADPTSLIESVRVAVRLVQSPGP